MVFMMVLVCADSEAKQSFFSVFLRGGRVFGASPPLYHKMNPKGALVKHNFQKKSQKKDPAFRRGPCLLILVNQVVILIRPEGEEEVTGVVPDRHRELVTPVGKLTVSDEIVTIGLHDEVKQRNRQRVQRAGDSAHLVDTNFG